MKTVSSGYNLIEYNPFRGLTCLVKLETGDTFQHRKLGRLEKGEDQFMPIHNLLAGSPAIDGGEGPSCHDLDGNQIKVDQRRLVRPQDGLGKSVLKCDIGAIEYVPYCGDGMVQKSEGELCDIRIANGEKGSCPTLISDCPVSTDPNQSVTIMHHGTCGAKCIFYQKKKEEIKKEDKKEDKKEYKKEDKKEKVEKKEEKSKKEKEPRLSNGGESSNEGGGSIKSQEEINSDSLADKPTSRSVDVFESDPAKSFVGPGTFGGCSLISY